MNKVHVAQIDLNLLVVFDELLRSRSTTVAARRLGRTQSAVSHALRRLRSSFGDPLFVRAGSSLSPTATAERLRAPLGDVLSRAESLFTHADAGFDPSVIERTFTFAGTDYSEILLMPRILPELRRLAPLVDIVTRPVGDEIERAIKNRDVDIAFGTGFRMLPGVQVDPIRDDNLLVFMRRGHPALRGKLTPSRYAALDHVLVSPSGRSGSIIDTELESLALERRVVLRLPYFGAAAAVVASTDLVVSLPAALVSPVTRGFGLVSRPVPFAVKSFTFSMIYSTVYRDDPAHRWLRELVLAAGRAR